ncbi:hypothetical protein BGZ82_003024, partial [Podila clonocystis]
HLNVICNPVGNDTAKSITQVLGSVPWDTLKSLVLSGNSTNEWMDLWPPTEAPRLLGLQIRSTGSAVQELSHSSVLFVHQIAQSSPLGRLEFEGVQMRDKRDWTVIVDSVDPSFLTKLGLCERGLSQFESSPAVDQFKSKFDTPLRILTKTPTINHRQIEATASTRSSVWQPHPKVVVRPQPTPMYQLVIETVEEEYDSGPDEEYTVVYIDGQGVQSDNYRYQEDNSVASPIDFFAPLERLVATTMYLFDRLKLVPNAARETFLQLVANARYYHILLMEEIARLDESGFKAQFGEIDRAQVLIQLQELEDQLPDWDYRNVCFNMFYGVQTKWDYATSKLFIVLPSDLKSWDDQTPSTRNFRLYFLCDNRMDVVAQSRIPQHVHISNHPGYNLLKPQEFFEKYGDYVLRVLWMVKLGYSNNACDIPSIQTPSILWKHTHASSILTKCTIRKLVDKAIAHIEQISPPKWIMEPGLSRNRSAGIKEYFHVQEGDNAEGNLQRHIDSHQRVSWRCQVHKEQHFDWKHLIDLKGYVDGRMGHVDMQQARLQVSLQSYADSDQLQRRLAGITQSFNLSIKLSWNTTRTDVEKLCRTIAQRKTVALEIDGISVNIYPRGYVPYTRNIFADNVVPDTDTGLQLITVLNYPVLDEHCIHIGSFSLQSGLSPTRLTHSWVDLRADLDRFGKLISNAQEMSECKAELRSVQKKHGLSDTTIVTMHGGNWGAVFDLKDCAVVEAYSLDAACPRVVHSSGSLRKLTVDLHDLKFDKEFFQLVKTSPDLHELNVSYRGHDVFYYFEHIVKGWQESSSRYCLTLLDRLEDTQGRVVARMTVQRCGSEGSGSALRADQLNSVSPSAQKKAMDAPSTNINYLDWNIDS